MKRTTPWTIAFECVGEESYLPQKRDLRNEPPATHLDLGDKDGHALAQILRRHPCPDRVFAQAVSQRWFYERTYLNGLTVSPSAACCLRLIGRRCSHVGHDCQPPGADHSYLLLKDRAPYAFVTHPYGLDDGTVQALVQYCNRLGLSFWMDASGSWWFPGATLAVVIRKRPGKHVGGPLEDDEDADSE